MQLNVLQPATYATEPTCDICSLANSKERNGVCPPKPTRGTSNGLMVVGEGPGRSEIAQRAPFVGRSGQLLDALLESAGIDRDATYITNATSCLPPPVPNDDKRGFHERHPLAAYACLPRLEAEIARVRPRVILALGQVALTALTGRAEEFVKRIPFECPVCGNPPKRLKACPGCNGYKTKPETQTVFDSDNRIGLVAGSVFHTETLPSRLDEFGVKYIIATYHPSYILRKAETKTQAQVGGQFIAAAVSNHMLKANKLLHAEASWSCKPVITRDPEVVARFLSQKAPFFVADIETDALSPWDVTEIKCIGIGVPGSDEVLVVDTRSISPRLVGGSDDRLLAVLRDFLQDPQRKKVWQNRFYDEQVWFVRHGIVTRGTRYDTMLMHHALYPDEPHHLQHITARYTDSPPWKPPKSKGGIDVFETFEELATYNANDVRNTTLIVSPLEAELQLEHVSAVHELDMAMTDIALEMQAAGMPLDPVRLGELGREAQENADRAFAEMDEIIGTNRPTEIFCGDKKKGIAPGTFVPTSPRQLQWVLFSPDGPCRITSLVRTKTGESTAKDVLNKYNHPFVRALLRYRVHNSVISHYIKGDGLTPAGDGRIHPQWNVTGARTGRWSSSPNFQNWPKRVRSAIRAPEGRKFIGCDYDQLELRVIAALSGDEEMIRRCMTADNTRKLEPDFDPHSFVASLAFGRVFLDADPNDPKDNYALAKDGKCGCGKCRRNNLRNATKRVVYGLNYGAGAAKILDVILDGGWTGGPLTVDTVERIVRAYFRGFPKVPLWRDQQLERARETHEVRSPILGRRRYFPLGDVDATVAYNFPIQSGAADIMNTQIRVLSGLLYDVDPTAFFIAQVHDAIYLEVEAARAQQVCDLVTRTMTIELSLVEGAPAMRFSADATIGDTWDAV